MQSFEFILENEKVKSYRLIRFFLVVANIVGMIWLLYTTQRDVYKIWPAISLGALVVTLAFILTDIFTKKHSAYNRRARMAYLWCAIAWSRSPIWWFALLMILFFLFDIFAHRKLVVRVESEGVSYPSLVNKSIEWNEISNLMLKDGLLTIDLKNNKLFQHLISNAETGVNEKEFNEFCREKLKAVKGDSI